MIFSGTLRYNLDPMNKHTDAKIWSVLEAVELKDRIRSISSHGLMFNINPTRSSIKRFTSDELQLISLARAVLKEPKVVVIDELSVDRKTGAIISKIVKRDFKNSTVLTIVQKLSSMTLLGNCNSVLCLINSEKSCSGTLGEMLIDEKSVFRQLVDLLPDQDRKSLFDSASRQIALNSYH